MTKIEVEDFGNHTLLCIWTGTYRGTVISTTIYLTPKQRQQLIKDLQHSKQQSDYDQ